MSFCVQSSCETSFLYDVYFRSSTVDVIQVVVNERTHVGSKARSGREGGNYNPENVCKTGYHLYTGEHQVSFSFHQYTLTIYFYRTLYILLSTVEYVLSDTPILSQKSRKRYGITQSKSVIHRLLTPDYSESVVKGTMLLKAKQVTSNRKIHSLKNTR